MRYILVGSENLQNSSNVDLISAHFIETDDISINRLQMNYQNNMFGDFQLRIEFDHFYNELGFPLTLYPDQDLDENGFLPIEPILIADRLGYEESFVLDVKRKIASLDPPGIGSLSIQECIVAQLRKYHDKNMLALEIIKNYLQYLLYYWILFPLDH